MNKYRANGGISIVDRYPQLQQKGINDGLKLEKFTKLLNNPLIRRMEKNEKKLLQIVNEIYPDIVFRLNISVEMSMKRKPDENIDYEHFSNKANLVKQLKFNKSKLYEIDAEQDYDEVLIEIKRKIWESL